jgi:hypothetical protein
VSLGFHLQVLPPTTTRLYSRHQLIHALRGGIFVIPFLTLLPPLIFFVLADAGSIHLNFSKVKPINDRNASRNRAATSRRSFCISAKMFHLNFNMVKPINARNTRIRVATSHQCFCISSTTGSLLLSSPSLNFLVLVDTPYVSCLNAPPMARKHGVAIEAEDAVASSAHRYAPSIPTCLEPTSKKSSRTRRHVMGECVNAKGRRKRP